jgi:ribosome-associated protein
LQTGGLSGTGPAIRHARRVRDDLQVKPGLVLPAAELRWRFSRASGPGGQSVNTTDSRVELTFDVLGSAALSATQRERARQRLAGRLVDGVLTVVAAEHRSQLTNRRAAADRLAETLRTAVAAPPRPRRPTRPTKGSVERRLAGKRRRAETKRARRDLGD